MELWIYSISLVGRCLDHIGSLSDFLEIVDHKSCDNGLPESMMNNFDSVMNFI